MNRESVSPCLQEDLPLHHTFTPLFLIYRSSPLGKVIKTYFPPPPPLKKGGGGLNYVSFHTSCLISVIMRKKAFSVVSSGLESDFYPPLSCSYIYIYICIDMCIYNIYICIYIYIYTYIYIYILYSLL